jgi:hypothetical protein
MQAPMFAPPPPFHAQERVVHRLLDKSPLFADYAETIGDGWDDLVAAAGRLDEESKRISAEPRPAVAGIGSAIFIDGFDIDDHVSEIRAARAAEALRGDRADVMRMARMALLDAANGWVSAHGAQLLKMIQDRRLAIQAELRLLLADQLDGMSSARDLAHRPQHVEAYGRMQALLAEWQRLRDVHAGIIGSDRQDVLWFGASWVRNYAAAWPDLRKDGGAQPPWQVTDEFELSSLIANQIQVWTPSLAELDQHIDNLTRAAERRREERIEQSNRNVSVPR